MEKLPQRLVNVPRRRPRRGDGQRRARTRRGRRESAALEGRGRVLVRPSRHRAARARHGRGADRRRGRRGLQSAREHRAGCRPRRPRRLKRSCAASSATSGSARCRSSCSRACASSSTAATTPRASRSSPTARSTRSAPSATSTTSSGRWPPSATPSRSHDAGHDRASATRAGPRTAASTRSNAHPHFDTTTASTSSSTASSRTTWRSSSACATSAPSSPARPTPRSSRTSSPTTWPPARSVEAVRRAYAELEGHFAFVAMSARRPGHARRRPQECPLVIGRGDGETFLASAIPAFLAHTRHVQYIENGEIVVVTPEGATFITPGRRAARARGRRDRLGRGDRREGRLRDVHAQGDPRAGRRGRRDDRRPHGARRRRRPRRRGRRSTRRSCATPSGSSSSAAARRYHAGLIGRYAIEQWARMPVERRRRLRVPLPRPGRRPGRPRHRHHAVGRDGRHARRDAHRARARRDRPRVTNVMGSQATRDADGVLFTRAGLEVCVAATKTFVCQVAAMYLLGLRLAELRGTLRRPSACAELVTELKRLPHDIDELLAERRRRGRSRGRRALREGLLPLPRPPRRRCRSRSRAR